MNRRQLGTALKVFVWTAVGLLGMACQQSGGGGSSYSFTSAASSKFQLNSRAEDTRASRATGPTLCSSVVCATPSVLTGKYLATGLLIQSSGSGMVAYFGQSNFSDITGTSTALSFDSASPITHTGTLTCCGGTGNLASTNTYISDIIYMFGYLDATFTLTGTSGMNGPHTVRFVLADGAYTGASRGDLLISDSGTFKWVDSSGNLSTTRPTAPITMNSSVTSWTNPYGTNQGNQSIPVIYAGALPSTGTGVVAVTETELETANRTYTYKFDPTNFVMFPEILSGGQTAISSNKTMLEKIHLGGLPHSAQTNGVGNPASTVLTVTTE